MNYLEVSSLTKTIGTAKVLDNISFNVEKEKICGFVGKNGSGKTMLFRCICGLVKPTIGTVLISNKELWKEINVPTSVGVVIENMGLWSHLNGFDNLKILAKIKNIATSQQIKDTITRVGLDPNDKRPFRKYSLGMRQRLIIAQAIMEKPEMLVLDEPTNGLDESGVELIRNVILEEKQRGATILLASHNKEDIACLCDTIYSIKEGALSDFEKQDTAKIRKDGVTENETC